MRRPFLLPLFAPLAVASLAALWSCVQGAPPSGASVGGAGGASAFGGGGGGGAGGTGVASGAGGALPTPDAGSACTLDNGTDPVGLCTQKLVLRSEHQAAFDATRGVAQSWDSATLSPDVGAGSQVLHDPRDDAAFGAACARYHKSATTYGNTEITQTLDGDLVALVPLLMTELGTPPAGYAGELYQDLRTAAGGLNVLQRTDLGGSVEMLAEGYGRAIYTTYYVPLGSPLGPDGGAGDAGPNLPDAVLGTPAGGGATAYAAGDAATGALALIDLAVRHASDDPASSAMWQSAAAAVLEHLHQRARDGATGLYFASLVTSGDPGHDALAPAAPSGPPADALLTEVNARVALAMLRAQALANASAPGTIDAVAALPLEARAEALLAALDATPQPLWDPVGPLPPDGGASVGGGYFTGWVPSTSQILPGKPTRANALALAALHDATVMGNGPDAARIRALRGLLADLTLVNAGFMTVLDMQSGYFFTTPSAFTFAGWDGGADPREKSYFSSANTAAVEGLSELWLGLTP